MPEPETPATATRRPSGRRTVTSRRLFCRAPTMVIAPSARRNGTTRGRAAGRPARPGAPRRTPDARPRPRGPAARRSSPVAEPLTRARARGVPSKRTRPPRRPAPGPRSIRWSAASIASGSCSTTTTVLPRSASLRRMREQPPGVHGVQADRRLVEHVERSGQRARRERRRDRCAAPRRRRACARGARERQVAEPDVVHVADAGRELREHRAEALLLGGRRRDLGEEALQVPQRELRELGDRAAAEADPERRRREAGAAAGGAGRVGPITREQDPHVDLVALGLEPVEEPLDAVEVAAALEEDLALVGREARHRNVRADRVPPAGAEEVVVGGLVGRRVPGRDRALRQREPVGPGSPSRDPRR